MLEFRISISPINKKRNVKALGYVFQKFILSFSVKRQVGRAHSFVLSHLLKLGNQVKRMIQEGIPSVKGIKEAKIWKDTKKMCKY